MAEPIRITATLRFDCAGERFKNAAEAVETIRVMRQKPDLKWVAKACGKCGGWHLFELPIRERAHG